MGEQLDLKGGKLLVKYKDGKQEKIDLTAEGVTILGYDSSKSGSQLLTVEYYGIQAALRFAVNVAELEIQYIYVVVGPNKTEYKQGEALDLTGEKK